MPPAGILLDVNETLFSLEPIAQRFEGAGLAPSDLDTWFARVLRDGFALAATDAATEFRTIAAHHLAVLLDARGQDTDAVDGVLEGFQEVEPHPDVAESLRSAVDQGLELATLTNGSAEITRSFLHRAGLEDTVATVLEARESGVWKPHPRAYRWAARRLGHEPADLALIAVHPWDIHGAVGADLTGGWLDRAGDTYPDHFHPPSLVGSTLGEVVSAIAAIT